MKKAKTIFWITTLILVLFEGIMPLFSFNSEVAKAGIAHLGYPEYFGVLLVAFKVLGAIGLILPSVKGNVKEWVYAGFGFDFTFAFLSYLVVDGLTFNLILPVICMIILALSYRAYHKIKHLSTAQQI